MPRITGIPGPYHLFFVSFDCAEPPHVHVVRENSEAKIWLESLSVAYNFGFTPRELRRIITLVRVHLPRIRKAWHDHCNPT